MKKFSSGSQLICALLWPGRAIAIRKASENTPIFFTLDKTNGECIVFQAEAGHRYQLEIT
jgi:hypothetical protein